MQFSSLDPAYLYTEQWCHFDFGSSHPFRINRLALTDQFLKYLKIDRKPAVFQSTTDFELTMFHNKDYLNVLKECSNPLSSSLNYSKYGLGQGDNPIFPGVFEWSSLLTGATLKAFELVSSLKNPAAFNTAGGMHHALPSKASGFCYINDAAILIKKIIKQNYRVAYIDIDAHHGDGVQWAFYDNPEVLTISFHQHPSTLFPGTGFSEEIGLKKGKGFSINIPLWPGTNDEIYIECFDSIVPPLIEKFKPDFIITQLGTDAHWSDPLANLKLTTKSYVHCLKYFRNKFWGRWIAVGGGGYDTLCVAKCWTIAWAIMLKQEEKLSSQLPQFLCEQFNLKGNKQFLFDQETDIRDDNFSDAKKTAKNSINFIENNIFPIIKET